MKFVRSRELTVNMGNYESLKIGGSVEVDEATSPELLDQMLDNLLEAEVKEARELTNTANSYVLSYRNANA